MTRWTRARGLVASPLWTAASALGAPPAFARASLFEGFESAGTVPSGQHGPGGRIASGGKLRNRSEPAGSGDWRRSAWAHPGNGSLLVDSTVGLREDVKSESATWVILPALSGPSAGDEGRSFFTCGSAPPRVPTARLEGPLSPSGGTLHAFHVQASHDGGRTWHFVREDLPAATRRASFRLPTGTGIPDMRLRVIAVDLRLRNSSDGAQHAFAIGPGNGDAGTKTRRVRHTPSSTGTTLSR